MTLGKTQSNKVHQGVWSLSWGRERMHLHLCAPTHTQHPHTHDLSSAHKCPLKRKPECGLKNQSHECRWDSLWRFVTILTIMGWNYVLLSGRFGIDSWLSYFSAVWLGKHGLTSLSFTLHRNQVFFFPVKSQIVNILDLGARRYSSQLLNCTFAAGKQP